MAAKAKPHVLIVGAGVGGLSLAQALRKKGLSFEIFEQHRNKNHSQGTSLGLHSVLERLDASVADDMPPIASTHHLRPLSLPAQLIYYDNANPSLRIGVEDPGDNSIIRVHRPRVLSWLGTNIPIRVDKTACAIEEALDSVTVRFTDGTSATGDILIGADGVHSVVRKHLLSTLNMPDPIEDLPIKVVIGTVSLSGEAFERQLSLGYSSWRVTKEADETGPAVRFFVGLDYVEPDGMSGSYFWIMTDPVPEALEATSKQQVLDIMRQQASGLKPQFKEILDIATPDSINTSWVLRTLTLDKLPVGRVTLLGDAAHCMAPFRGEGAVHAIRDALNLAEAIEKIAQTQYERHELEQLIKDYQEEMLERGKRAVQVSLGAYQSDNSGRVTWGQDVHEIPESRVILSKVLRSI